MIKSLIALVCLMFALISSDLVEAAARKEKKKARPASGRISKNTRLAKGRSTRSGKPHRARRGRRRSYTSKAVVAPTRTIGSTISRERVIEIQQRLVRLGFLDEPASGDYDHATIDAMKRFQSHHGLTANGRPSAPTLKKLGVSKNSNDGYSTPVRRDSTLSPDGPGS